jgi:outer membrane protein assembly factor BamB
MKALVRENWFRAFALLGLFAIGTSIALAENWPGWRGPTGLGVSTEKDLPLTWNGKTGQNILWKAPIKGYGPKADFSSPGHSSPIVWGDRIFITTSVWPPEMTDEKDRRKFIAAQHVVCYRTTDGKELWDTLVPPGEIVNNNVYYGYTVSTPATDGKLVYALFGSGIAVALDFDGKIVWREELPGMKNPDGGFGTSPLLYGDLVIVPGFKYSGLRALDKKSGKLRWEQKLPGKNAATNVQSTPAVLRIGGSDQLIHYAGGVQGIDPATGETLWSCRAPSGWASPVYGSGLLYLDEGRGGKTGSAVDPVGTGDLTKTNIKWTTEVKGAAGTSAIVVGDYLYRACDQGYIRCWKLTTGESEFEERVKGLSPSSSPFSTPDGRIYFASPKRTFVLKAGPSFELLATNDLETDGGAQDYTTPAVSDGRIYFKGRSTLWCVGKKE